MATARKLAGDVKDIGLADLGKRRIEWANQQMPVLQSIRKRFIKEQPLKGLRLSACLHVTSETANLAIALQRTGAKVGLMDTDVYGPSVPILMGGDAQPKVVEGKIEPPVANVTVDSMHAPISLAAIARGIPVGGSLNYADSQTLKRAFEGRSNY